MRLLISGASGLVGTALTKSLEADGHEVIALVRKGPTGPKAFLWDPARGEVDPRAFEGVDAVVHLAGESVAAGRWTDALKQRIKQSRIDGTRTLVNAVLRLAPDTRPEAFVCASAIGYYGHTNGRPADENAPRGEGFLAEVVEAWENEALPLDRSNVRLVRVRIGVVLAKDGGALEKMLLPFKLGLGGPISDGRAWFPWVHLDDVVGAIRFALEREDVRGALNAVAPEPATNGVFTKALARVLGRPAIFRVPAFALKLAAGKEMAEEMLLADARVVPRVLAEAGYVYRQPLLEPALRDLVG